MRGITIVILGASVVGTVFFLSLFELLFTIKRRKTHAELEKKLQDIKAAHNEAINQVVVADEQKLKELEDAKKAAAEAMQAEKDAVAEEYEGKIDDLKEHADKALANAKARAKKLEKEAEMKADEYLATRQKEVEHDLLDLVLSVTKKVLPDSLTYDIHKELVLAALRDVKADGGKES